MKTIAELVRDYRKESGLSLRDLAAVTGVSASSLCRIESGEENPTQKTVDAILSWVEKGKKLPPIVSLLERIEYLEKRIEALESK